MFIGDQIFSVGPELSYWLFIHLFFILFESIVLFLKTLV